MPLLSLPLMKAPVLTLPELAMPVLECPPELKNPDDGTDVVFPKPGTAGTSTPCSGIGPTLMPAPTFTGMRSIVIGGVLKPSI